LQDPPRLGRDTLGRNRVARKRLRSPVSRRGEAREGRTLRRPAAVAGKPRGGERPGEQRLGAAFTRRERVSTGRSEEGSEAAVREGQPEREERQESNERREALRLTGRKKLWRLKA